jgi:hypothetical protein
MKTTFSLLLVVLVMGFVAGCEHENHHRDSYGGPGPGYESGFGPRYDQGWDQR